MPAHPIRLAEIPPFGRAIRILPGRAPAPARAEPAEDPAAHDFLVVNPRPDLLGPGPSEAGARLDAGRL